MKNSQWKSRKLIKLEKNQRKKLKSNLKKYLLNGADITVAAGAVVMVAAGVETMVAAGVETMVVGAVAGESAIQHQSMLQLGAELIHQFILLVIFCGDKKSDLNNVKLFFSNN